MVRKHKTAAFQRPHPRKRLARWRKPRTPPELRRMIERMREEFKEGDVPLEELRRNLAEDLGDQSLSELFIKMKGP